MTTVVRASVLTCPEWCEDDHTGTVDDLCQMHHQPEQAITANEGKACFYLTRYDDHGGATKPPVVGTPGFVMTTEIDLWDMGGCASVFMNSGQVRSFGERLIATANLMDQRTERRRTV